MARDGRTRRQVLERVGQVTAAGAVASTAGCLDAIPFLGGYGYQKWLHEPGPVGGGDHYGFQLFQPKVIQNKEDELQDRFVDSFGRLGPVGGAVDLDGEDVKHFLRFTGFQVLNTTVSEGDVTDELEDNDFEEEGCHEGFTIYVNGDTSSNYPGWGAAVKGKQLVTARGAPDGEGIQDRLETPVDAWTGNGDRYVDESDAMNQLIDTAGTKHLVVGRTFEEQTESNPEQGEFEGLVGEGSTLQIQAEDTNIRRLYVFEDNGAAKDAAVDDWADSREDGDDVWSEANDGITVNVNGPVAIGKASVPSDELVGD